MEESVLPLRRRVFSLMALGAAGSLAIWLAACGGGNVTVSGGFNPPQGTVSVSITDPPSCRFPAGSFQSVWVTIRSVQAHISTTAGDGSSGWQELAAFGQVANKVGALCVVLNDVPNQPLFGGLTEDALISYTFVEFAKSKDVTWPALLPMTKSAVRAMTAVQEVAKKQWGIDVKEFLVTGGSKRGWTTWLTAAVDKRVRAIAPLVYDILNFPKQLPHQVATWGKYSEMIADYSTKGLTEMLSTAEGQTLTAIVDPYSYRERFKMPKMVINGANDRYWVIDAARFYFNDLPGEKYLMYVPNAGHSLQEGLQRVVNNLTAFYLAVASRQPLAEIKADVKRQGNKLLVTVTTKGKVDGVQIWTAQSSTKDLRNSRWTAQNAQPAGNGKYTVEIALPTDAMSFALFADAQGTVNGTEYHVCTVPVVAVLK